ncbi:unnamed protein product [Symbiodinium sp. CCMP2592]|nr:unnamed protein product [Symbiodinium sp. CCMP2592]
MSSDHTFVVPDTNGGPVYRVSMRQHGELDLFVFQEGERATFRDITLRSRILGTDEDPVATLDYSIDNTAEIQNRVQAEKYLKANIAKMNDMMSGVSINTDGSRPESQVVAVLDLIASRMPEDDDEFLKANILPLWQSNFVDSILGKDVDLSVLSEEDLGNLCVTKVQDAYGKFPLNVYPSTLRKIVKLGKETYGCSASVENYDERLAKVVTAVRGQVSESSQNLTHVATVTSGSFQLLLDVVGGFGPPQRSIGDRRTIAETSMLHYITRAAPLSTPIGQDLVHEREVRRIAQEAGRSFESRILIRFTRGSQSPMLTSEMSSIFHHIAERGDVSPFIQEITSAAIESILFGFEARALDQLALASSLPSRAPPFLCHSSLCLALVCFLVSPAESIVVVSLCTILCYFIVVVINPLLVFIGVIFCWVEPSTAAAVHSCEKWKECSLVFSNLLVHRDFYLDTVVLEVFFFFLVMADNLETQPAELSDMQVEGGIGEVPGSPAELAEDISDNESSEHGVDAEMKVKMEKRKRGDRDYRRRCDPRAHPVPDSDDEEDEDSPSKRPQLGEEKPLTAREIRELLIGHVSEMKCAWKTFQGRLDDVEREQARSSFEVTNLQARTRVVEKDLGQQRETTTQHAKALENLTDEVQKMKVKLDDIQSRPQPGPAALQPNLLLKYHLLILGVNIFASRENEMFLSYHLHRTIPGDTKRSVIEEESSEILNHAEIKDLLDSHKLLVFGPRRSVGMLRFQVRDGETFEDTKKRMWEIVRALGRIKHILPSTSAGGDERTLWGSFVKTKNARLRTAHVSMARRVVIALAKDNGGQNGGANTLITNDDCDWNMGTIWNGSEKIGSATHRQPKNADEIVLMPGGWINISAAARVSGSSTDDARCQSLELLDVACKDCDIVFVQEVARREVGWDSFDTDEFHWVTFQDAKQWRGVAIGVSLDKFDSVMHKVATERGIWLVARIIGIGRIVLGSAHCHTGVTTTVYQSAAQAFARSCPHKYRHLPALCGIDANEVPCWEESGSENGGFTIGTCSSNLNALVYELLQQGVCPVAPRKSDLNTATHYPRDETRTGRQIDMLCARLIHACPVIIEPERRFAVGSDHAIALCDLWTRQGSGRVQWGNDSRARWVHKQLPDTIIVDEDDLIALAKECTRPRSSAKFVDTPEIKDAIVEARKSNAVRDWKTVHRMRKQARRDWSQARLCRILNGDWDQYRSLQNDKKRKRGLWGHMLSECGSKVLAKEITQHLEGKMVHPTRSADEWGAKLQCLIDSVEERGDFVPFTLIDVRAELHGMKCKSAVGPDGIGVHLLRELAEHEVLGEQFLELINHIVEHRELPGSWHTSFLALLAKINLPTQPSDLRPICVSSAFHKLVNRLVCARALPLMRKGSKISCCGKGRQAADLLGTISRMRDVTKEWSEPLILCKLDVAGAFDKLDREKVADLLLGRLRGKGVKFELKYLLEQLAVHRLLGNAPGGKPVDLCPDNGIKQGAPESAELFGLVIDSLLSCLVNCRQWGELGLPFSEADIDLLFFQDDIFIVETQFARLCKRIAIVDRCLQQAGLSLARNKTKIVANEHYVGARRAKLGDDFFTIAPHGESLKVLGVSFSLCRDASEQAREIITRTRNAAFEHKPILNAPGAWKNKISIMKTLVESQFNWTAGALHWGKDDLHTMNVAQLMFVGVHLVFVGLQAKGGCSGTKGP